MIRTPKGDTHGWAESTDECRVSLLVRCTDLCHLCIKVSEAAAREYPFCGVVREMFANACRKCLIMLPRYAIWGNRSTMGMRLLPLALLCVSGCAWSRTPPPLDAHAIQSIQAYDCRTISDHSTSRFERVIEDERDIAAIVALIDKYRDDWSMLRCSEPMGELRLAFCGRDASGNPTYLGVYAFLDSSVVTVAKGGPIGHDMSLADREILCRLVGIDDTFFDESAGLDDTLEPRDAQHSGENADPSGQGEARKGSSEKSPRSGG